MHKFWLLTMIFLILPFCSIDAKADTLSLGGGVSFSGFLGNFNVNLSGFNSPGTTFSASGFGATSAGINVTRPFLAPGGTSLNLSGSAFLIGADFSFGSFVVINGVTYAVHTVNVTMQATSVTIPFTTANTLALTAPCTVTGGVSGQSVFTIVGVGFNGLCGATLNLTKAGIDAQGNGLYTFQSISYGFSSAPVPEPSTLLVLGTGLLGIAVKVGKRRKSV